MKTPDFEVTQHGMGVAVGWEDAERRYHFWLDETSGLPQGDTLHSNLKVKPEKYGDHGHRKMSLAAKRWEPIVAAMIEKIRASGLVAKAREKAEAKKQADAAERVREANVRHLARLESALRHLPAAERNMIRVLPEATKIAFASTFD